MTGYSKKECSKAEFTKGRLWGVPTFLTLEKEMAGGALAVSSETERDVEGCHAQATTGPREEGEHREAQGSFPIKLPTENM